MKSKGAAVLLFLLAVASEARRWRFAAPFPGKMETMKPDLSNHNPFDDLAEREKIYDAQEMSKIQKPKLVDRVAINKKSEGDEEEKTNTNNKLAEKPRRMWGI